jgi:hypothetical protein
MRKILKQPQKGAKGAKINSSRPDMTVLFNFGKVGRWLGKSGGGPPYQSKTQCANREFLPTRQRRGVRQSSGALALNTFAPSVPYCGHDLK